MKWLLICLAAGLASACGFAPLDLWPLTLLGLAVLLLAVESAPRLRTALARGWMFGLGQFVLGLNWIATAFTYQSNMPAWLGWIGVVVLSFYLAIFPAAAAGLAWRWSGGDRLRLVLIFAAAWIVTEFLRAVLLTGFPWNPLGVSLLLTPAVGFSTLGGTYALSGLAILLAGIIYLLARSQWRGGGGLVLAVAALVLTAFIAAPAPGGEAGPAVRIVQPNVDQRTKHEEGYGLQLRRFREAAIRPGDEPRLLLWPEDGIPFLLDEDPDSVQMIAEWLVPGDAVLTGGVKVERGPDGRAVGARNSAYAISSSGQLLARYDKAHLVPFGEYLPLRPLLTALGLSRVVPGDLDYWEGPGPRTVDLRGFGRAGIQICYEIVFSGNVADRADRPDFIFNPSNDAWFGWWGPPQHLAQARLRALEEGLPVLRSTPTGVSAIIDARGNLVQAIPWREQGVIDGRLPPAAAPTLFARAGNLMPFLFALLLIAAAFASARLQSRSKRASEQRT
ncbi:MAG TPA: apolipoprotein N-acyltransferase [Allosphingosinicella sp.]